MNSSYAAKLFSLRRLIPGGDVGLSICVLFQLAILIVPIPTFLLDLALALSFVTSILILVVSLSLERPLDFSMLPTLLLLTTIFRLSLNVATARLILSHGSDGPMAAGKVVAAFGSFLMGGDVVVGSIIFSMLLMVNFIVITKGSSRIAEVSARFYLDSMPGKQMAIDADLSSGMINDQIAKFRRSELEEESAFYGAMDGASKFVRGDAVCALVITLINILGGLAMGMLRAQMPLETALGTFTTLTIGDGLVSQIPAILVSTAAGIVVSKGSNGGNMYRSLGLQLGSKLKVLVITAGAAGTLALLPGLPFVPFLIICFLISVIAWTRMNAQRSVDVQVDPMAAPNDNILAPVETLDLLRVELGYGLLELAGKNSQQLPEQIKRLRKALFLELGFVLPSIRIQDNAQLEPDHYSFILKDISAGHGQLRPSMMLAISPGEHASPLPGETTVEPTFGLPACWIAPNLADHARSTNWTVVDATTVLTTHLAEVVKENISEFLSYAETQRVLTALPQEQQKLVGDLIPALISIGGLQRILQMLLAERISIRDVPTILEAIQEASASHSKTIGSIVSHVRTRLARQISDSYMVSAGYIPVIVLSPEWEETFVGSVVGPPEDRQLALRQERLLEFLDRLRAIVDVVLQSAEKPVLLTSTQIRSHVHSIVDRVRMNVPVIAQAEIHRRARIKVVGTV